MSGVSGARVTIGAYDEATYKNVGGSPSGRRLYYSNFNVQPQAGRTVSEVLSGYRGRARSVLDRRSVGGQIATELGPETIGWWLQHLIGTPTTTGTGPYTHTFAVGDGAQALPPGITFEQDFTSKIAAPGRYMRYKGCRIARGSMTINPNGFIPVSFDVLGADWDNEGTAPLDATLTDTGHRSFSAANVAVALSDGSAIDVCLRSLTLNWSNDLDEDQFCISAGGVRDGLDEGFVSLDGQVTALFDSEAFLRKTLADTDAQLVVTLQRGSGNGTAGNEQLVWTIPDLVFAPTAPTVAGPRGLLMQANWNAHRSSGEIGSTVVLKNALATV